MVEPEFLPQIPSPRSGGRRKGSDSNSPEFEFWTSFPQPNLLSADELFSGGLIVPLHLINHSNEPPPAPEDQETDVPSGSGYEVLDPEPSSTHELADLSATPALTSSKRWMDIFKKSDKKFTSHSSKDTSRDDINKEKCSKGNAKEKKREKKNGVGVSTGVNAAELNINIWPFSRSRSAGNGGTRPRAAAAASHRKVSSAPCSRSNSGGESKTRKWPSSPSRGGVHLGRSSPVWQARRSGTACEGRRKIPSGAGGGCKTRVLSLNVPMCIGYGHGLSCRSDENGAVGVAAGDVNAGGGRNGVAGEGVRVGNLFNIRGLFTRKVY